MILDLYPEDTKRLKPVLYQDLEDFESNRKIIRSNGTYTPLY
jgi:hypothetical protein